MNQRVRFSLQIPTAEVLAYYKGAAKQVSVLAYDGRRIEFPAEKLRPFMSEDGVYGEFEMEFDREHRFVSMLRVT